MTKDRGDRGTHDIPVHPLVFERPIQRGTASTCKDPRRPPGRFISWMRLFLGSWYAVSVCIHPCCSSTPGDFEEIYGAVDTDASEPHAGQWDAVLTCFFIDTVRLGSSFRKSRDSIQPLSRPRIS